MCVCVCVCVFDLDHFNERLLNLPSSTCLHKCTRHTDLCILTYSASASNCSTFLQWYTMKIHFRQVDVCQIVSLRVIWRMCVVEGHLACVTLPSYPLEEWPWGKQSCATLAPWLRAQFVFASLLPLSVFSSCFLQLCFSDSLHKRACRTGQSRGQWFLLISSDCACVLPYPTTKS